MGKLFHLKRWLTLSEGAKALTAELREEVTETDLLQFALEGKLTLSVVFLTRVLACVCKPVVAAQVEYIEVPSLDGAELLKLPLGLIALENGSFVQVQKDQVFWLDDERAFDLLMVGGERCDIADRYWRAAGETKEEMIHLDGVFVESEGTVFQLRGQFAKEDKRPHDHYPLGNLPDEVAVVVKPKALSALKQLLTDDFSSEEKILASRERDTLLKLLIGMAVAGYSYNPAASKSPVTKEIADDLASLGISVSDDTVRKYLKQAAETVLPAKPRQS